MEKEYRFCFPAALKYENLPSECSYYEGLQKCLGLMPDGKVYTSEQVEKLVEVYSNLRQKYPRSAAAKVSSRNIRTSVTGFDDMEMINLQTIMFVEIRSRPLWW